MPRSTAGKRAAPRKSGAAKGSSKPNLPQHHHAAPYSTLLTLGYGDFEEVYDEAAATLKQGDAAAAGRKLLAMVEDESYYDYDGEDYPGGTGGDPRGWTRLHAMRVLTRMGDAGRVGIAPFLELLDTEDDYLREDVPFYYAAMGGAAIEPLARTLGDPSAPSYRRSGAGESLAEIGEAHPELRETIILILERTLGTEQEDIALNAFLIISLCDLAAKQSLPIIEQVFKDDRADETIVSLAEVQEHFGVPITAERPKWQYGPGEPRRVDPHAETDPALDEDTASTPYVAPDKVGRNDLCPCGSGKKYKKCCGAPT